METPQVRSKLFLFSRAFAFDLALFLVGIYVAFVNDFGLNDMLGVGKHALWIIGAWNIYRRFKTWQAIGKEGKAWYRSKTIRDNAVFFVLAAANLWYALANSEPVLMPILSMLSASTNIWLRIAYTKTSIYPFTGE